MFNFRSLAAMIDQDEKNGNASHFEHAEEHSEKRDVSATGEGGSHGEAYLPKAPQSRLKEVTTSEELGDRTRQ